MPLNWNIDRVDQLLVNIIMKRAMEIIKSESLNHIEYQDLEMSLTACHINGTPLDLKKLIKADSGNFGHDVFGIWRFIDRETGQLTDCFLPRCALPETAAA